MINNGFQMQLMFIAFTLVLHPDSPRDFGAIYLLTYLLTVS